MSFGCSYLTVHKKVSGEMLTHVSRVRCYVPLQNTNHRFTQLSVLLRCQIVKVQKWAESTHTHTAQFLNSITLQSELARRNRPRRRHPLRCSGRLSDRSAQLLQNRCTPGR